MNSIGKHLKFGYKFRSCQILEEKHGSVDNFPVRKYRRKMKASVYQRSCCGNLIGAHKQYAAMSRRFFENSLKRKT